MNEQTCFPFVLCEPERRARRARVELVMEDGLELAERPRVRGPVLNRPELVVEYLREVAQWRPQQEKFWVVPLDRKNRAIGRHLLTLGTLTSALGHPREVFRICIASAAAAVICAHNHPSGVMPHLVLCRTATGFHSEAYHRHAA